MMDGVPDDGDAVTRRNRSHYDSKPSQSRRDRAHGPAAPLKTFHNQVKRELVNAFARNASSLLDVACGRGGDLAKWDAANVQTVLGIDNSDAEIVEARRRYGAGTFKTRCEFRVCPSLATEPWAVGVGYDVVTCMFALHYFCNTDATLRHVLQNIASVLKPGGFFVGTVPDGARVRQAVRETWGGPMLRIQPLWSGPHRPCGSAYLCDIADTVVAGGSIEYLVDEGTLIETARSVGLEPVTSYNPINPTVFDETRAPLFKHFAPRFPPGTEPSLERASRLFAAFAFQKVR
jgi:mRNA (guanine-N7-)-methyltransferase